MYKNNLASCNLQWLICHKTKSNQTNLCTVVSPSHECPGYDTKQSNGGALGNVE